MPWSLVELLSDPDYHPTEEETIQANALAFTIEVARDAGVPITPALWAEYEKNLAFFRELHAQAAMEKHDDVYY